ncbi:MAG: SDR family oxidoreductase [Proteobacteria bacterium]|nr:SDR family oxidoreductase [Pseudomonadota bacterium]
MGKLDGKVAVVTGGGRGVGRGIALALAREGAAIGIPEIDPNTGPKTAREIEGLPGRACAVPCDVSDREQVDRAVSAIVEQLGGVDILVNNATWNGDGEAMKPLLEHNERDMRRQFEVNVLGSFHFMQACHPHLRDGGGKVINLASMAGSERTEGFTAYAAAKEAVRALTGVAAREWGEEDIHVNVICPTAMTDTIRAFNAEHPEVRERLLAGTSLRREGDPERDIGRVVAFLASSDSDFMTGQTLWIDGGHVIHS